MRYNPFNMGNEMRWFVLPKGAASMSFPKANQNYFNNILVDIKENYWTWDSVS